VTELDDSDRDDAWTRRLLLGRGAAATAALGIGVPAALATGASGAELRAVTDPRPGRRRIVVWRGLDAWRSEAVAFELDRRGIVAEGTQVGFGPMAYRLQYRLDAREDFVTRRLVLTAEGNGWLRHLDLRHDGKGTWRTKTGASGRVNLPEPGGDVQAFQGALDCDLGYSPLTNLMPIRRSGLHRRPGAEDFLMAWVSVPDLSVVASAQRYEHVRETENGSIVRYVDRGLFPGFTANLRLDRSGVVERYPGLAARVRRKRAG
jgi:uncharacterized protein